MTSAYIRLTLTDVNDQYCNGKQHSYANIEQMELHNANKISSFRLVGVKAQIQSPRLIVTQKMHTLSAYTGLYLPTRFLQVCLLIMDVS